MAPPNFICLSLCVCVCPAFTAYILVTMGWILIKLGKNVGTSVQLIVLEFEHSVAKGNTTHKGQKFFFAFLCVSEHFESIETHLFYSKIFVNFALRAFARNGSKGVIFFFLHFYAFQSILSRLRHTFFSENFRAKRTRAKRARCEREARGREATE